MSPSELRDHCHRQMEIMGGPVASALLTLPGRWGKRDYKRLGRTGPKGRIVSEMQRGVLVRFDAREILDWLDREEARP